MNKDHLLATIHRAIILIWIFVLVLALFPLTANPVKPIKELASAITLFLLALSMLNMPVKPGSAYDWPRTPCLYIAFAWLGWSAICIPFSNFRVAGLDELRVYLVWMLIALFAARVFREPRHIKQLFLAICIAVCISSLYGVIQYAGLDPFPWATRDVEEYRGLPSTFGNPNFAGHTLILALALGGGLVSLTGTRWVALLMAPMIWHLYQTDMRGAPLGLAAGIALLIVAMLCRRYLKMPPLNKAVAALLITVLLGVMGAAALLPVSKMRTGFFFPTDGSLILRYNGYFGGVNMALDNPVFGVGPGAYSRENIAYWTPYEERWFALRQKRNMHTHMDLLETAIETGIPGLLLHLGLFVALLVRSLSLAYGSDSHVKRRLAWSLAVLFLAFFVDGLFGFNLRVPVSAALLFLLAGMLDNLLGAMPTPVVETPVAGNKRRREESTAPTPEEDEQPRILSSLALCAVALACSAWAGVVLAGEMYYQRAQGARMFAERATNPAHLAQALQDGEASGAIGRRLVFWDPRYPVLLGHLAMRRGDAETAIAHYRDGLAGEPYHPHTAANIARAFLGLALRSVRDTDNPDYDNMALLLNEAWHYAGHGARYCPPSPHVQDVQWRIARARAVLAEERGEDSTALWREVEEYVVASLDDGPQDPSAAYRALAQAYTRTGRPEKALTLMKRTLPETPGNDNMWNAFDAASRETETYGPLLDGLYQAFVTVRSRYADNPELWVAVIRRIARSYADYLEEPAGALPFVREGLQRMPDRSELWGILAGLPLNERRIETVCEAVTRYASDDDEDDADTPSYMVRACAGRATPSELTLASNELARAALQASGNQLAADLGGAASFIALILEQTQLPPQREAEIRANIATAFLEAGRFESAIEHFEWAIDHLPENAHARLISAQARALGLLDRQDEAIAMAEKAVALAPTDAMVQLTAARLLRRAQRIEEAKFAYKVAISALPETSPARQQAERELETIDVPDTPSTFVTEL